MDVYFYLGIDIPPDPDFWKTESALKNMKGIIKQERL